MTDIERYLNQALVCGITAALFTRLGFREQGIRWGRVSEAYHRKAEKLLKKGE